MSKINFHGATISAISLTDYYLAIRIVDMMVGSNNKVDILVKNISELRIDGELKNNDFISNMPYPDGEILTLRVADSNELFILVEWNDFTAKKSLIQSYNMKGSDIEIVEKQ